MLLQMTLSDRHTINKRHIYIDYASHMQLVIHAAMLRYAHIYTHVDQRNVRKRYQNRLFNINMVDHTYTSMM